MVLPTFAAAWFSAGVTVPEVTIDRAGATATVGMVALDSPDSMAVAPKGGVALAVAPLVTDPVPRSARVTVWVPVPVQVALSPTARSLGTQVMVPPSGSFTVTSVRGTLPVLATT